MRNTKNFMHNIGFLSITLIYLTVMTLAAFYDLSISKALYDPANSISQFVSHYGEWPVWVALVIYVAAVILLFVLYKTKVISFQNRKRWFEIALYLLMFIIVAGLFCQLIKALWGRVRFKTVFAAGDDLLFTPWYRINGINGHKSFFSGHTVISSAVFSLVYVSTRVKKLRGFKLPFLLLGFAYTGFVGFYRIVAGAHYLSDVVTGLYVGLALHFILGRLVMPSINRKLYTANSTQ